MEAGCQQEGYIPPEMVALRLDYLEGRALDEAVRSAVHCLASTSAPPDVSALGHLMTLVETFGEVRRAKQNAPADEDERYVTLYLSTSSIIVLLRAIEEHALPVHRIVSRDVIYRLRDTILAATVAEAIAGENPDTALTA